MHIIVASATYIFFFGHGAIAVIQYVEQILANDTGVHAVPSCYNIKSKVFQIDINKNNCKKIRKRIEIMGGPIKASCYR